MAWGLTALLRDKFNASEILVSLMLVYVATLVLGYLVYGPWKDPMGLQLSADQDFRRRSRRSAPDEGSRIHRPAAGRWLGGGTVGVFVPHPGGLCPAGGWAGTGGRRVCGSRRARFVDGVADSGGAAVWCVGGGQAHGQLTPYVPQAMVLRPSSWPSWDGCTPWAMVLSAIFMSMFYIGGNWRSRGLGLLKSLTGVFQACCCSRCWPATH